ncbi:MAG: PKD domain-containing protein [Minisyncoccia bacterium]
MIQPVTYYQPTQYIYQSVPTYSYQSYPDYYQYPTSYSYPTTYYQQPTQIYAYQTPSYPYYTNNQYTVTGQSNNSNELNISCSAEPSASAVGQPVTWTATVTGGAAPYTYSWSGSDGISGSQGSVTKYYDSAGEKTAIVMVTSANGLTSTHPCDNTLTVQGGGQGAYLPQTGAAAPSQTPVENGNPNAAAAALSNVPWGWLASLIILVLLGTMAYLLFERQKVKISP